MYRGSVELEDHDWSGGKGPTQKIKALFAFLLCRKTQGARKETLIDLLWPDPIDLKRATSSLHQALFYLRRALEPRLETGSLSSYIRHSEDRYYFDPQKPCWIDADAFTSYTNRAKALAQNGDLSEAVQYWEKAVDLYGGGFLLGVDAKYRNLEFYDWCVPRGYHFEQRFLAAKMAIARYYLADGDFELAMQHAKDILNVDPVFESAHCLIIQCLIKTGQIDDALCQYRMCKIELALREDRAPSKQTELLYQQILGNNLQFS